MITFFKVGKVVSIVVAALLLIAIGTLLAVQAFRQHANKKSFAIHSPDGIDEAGYVTIGGIQQWVQIRGRARDNPVLLCVHGGPGGTWIPVTRLFIPWEQDFTVVQWDQRGAGKTLRSTGAAIAGTMTIERMVQDGIEVAEYLRTHLRQDRIILLGHSWGSILGIQMAKRRPDLFHAFVGTGQAIDLPRSMEMGYAQVLKQARAANDRETVRALEKIGPPPFENLKEAAVFFGRMESYQPPSDHAAMHELERSLTSPPPEYSLWDQLARARGFKVVPTWRLYNEMLNIRLASLGPGFGVPIFIFQGTEDRITPVALAEDYLKTIQAPHSEMVRLEGGGHFAVWSMADRFGQELSLRVRPLARQ